MKGTVPEYLFSIVWFLIAGITTLKKPNLRCKTVPPAEFVSYTDTGSLFYVRVSDPCFYWDDGYRSSSQHWQPMAPVVLIPDHHIRNPSWLA